MSVQLTAEQVQQLLQRVVQLEQQVQNNAANFRPNMRPRAPPMFDGTDRKVAATLIDTLNIQNELRGIVLDQDKILFAKSIFTGPAMTWLKNVETSINNSWEAFVNAFNLNYQNVNEKRIAQHTLMTIEQSGSVVAYNEKFQKARYLCDGNLFGDEMCKELYWKGLKPLVRLNITEGRMLEMTILQLMSAAQTADTEIWQVNRTAAGKVSFTRNTGTASSGHTPSYSTVKVKTELAAVDQDVDEKQSLNAVNGDFKRPSKLSDQERAALIAKAKNGEIICFSCRRSGHYSSKCPAKWSPTNSKAQ